MLFMRFISSAGLGAAFAFLVGCAAHVDTGPQVTVHDEYDYYPAYQVYYSHHRHHYIYHDRGAWVSRPTPYVSVNTLSASPVVRMDFHDRPSRHHSRVVRQYPRHWRPSHGHHHPPSVAVPPTYP